MKKSVRVRVLVEVASTFHRGFSRKFVFVEGINFRRCRDCSKACACGYPFRNAEIICPPGWTCSVLGERYDGIVVFELQRVSVVSNSEV